MALALSACCAAGLPFHAAIAQGANAAGSPFELAYWQAIAASSDPALYEGYLQQFPHGTFAAIAKSRAAQGDKGSVPVALAPPAMAPAPALAASPATLPLTSVAATPVVPVAAADVPVALPSAALPSAVVTPDSVATPTTLTPAAETVSQPADTTAAASTTPVTTTPVTTTPVTTTPVTTNPADPVQTATTPASTTTFEPHPDRPGLSMPLGTPLSLLATAATAASVASAAQSAAADALKPDLSPTVTLASAAPAAEPVIANAALVSALGNQSSAITGAAMGTGGNLAASTPAQTLPVAALPDAAQPALASAQPVAAPQPWPAIVPAATPRPLVLASGNPMPYQPLATGAATPSQPGAAALRAAASAQDAAAAQVTPKVVPIPQPARRAAPPRVFRAIERTRPRRAPVIVAASYAPRRVLTTAATSPAMQDVGLMGGGGISPLGYMLTQLAYTQQTPGAGIGMPEEASLPMRPSFMPVPSMQVPAAFCSIDQRNAFHEGIYEPALAIAQHNNDLAVAYLTHLKSLYDSYQLSGDHRTIASIAAEARDFQPIAALAFSTQDNLVRAFEDIMATPVSTCGAIQ